MSFCSKCGATLDPSSQFCRNCGTPVSAASGPPQAPPPPQPAVWAQPPQPIPQYSSVDRMVLGKIKTFALVGIIGIIFGVVVPIFSGFTSFFSFNAASQLGAGAALLTAYVVIAIVGFVIGLFALIQIRSAYKILSKIDSKFSTPSTLVLGLFVGLILIIIAFVVLAGFIVSAITTIGPVTTPPTSLPANLIGILVAFIGLAGMAAVAALVGIIGIILGLWRAGDRYGQDLLKIGGIFYIIPVLDVAAPILVYLGALNAEKKIPPS